MTSPTTSPTWRHWAALVLLGLPLFMMATDITAIFLAMPAVAADLAPSSTQMLWLVHVGELVAAGTLITMGWLTGRVGPRTMLLLALLLYGIGSALAAYAPTAGVLLVARVLIGLATAAVTPAALAMLRHLFTSSRHHGIAFAVVMGAFPVGAALGPPLTGALLEHFWWGSAFLVNVPVATLALAGGLALFPRTRERTSDRIDLTSVVLSMAAIMLAVFALQEIADQGLSLAYGLAVGAGLGLGAWFVRRQRRISNPLLDLDLFAIRVLRVVTLFFLLAQAIFMAADFILVQYLQVVQGISTATLGLVMVAPGVAAIGSTALTPALTRRFTPRAVMTASMGIGLIGTAVIVVALTTRPDLVLFATGMTITSFGMSPAMVLGAQLMVTAVPRRQTGPAVAVQDISASLGAAGGIGLLGSLATIVFGRGVHARAPDAVPPVDLASAAESPGAAVAVAGDLPDAGAGAELLRVVDVAWTEGTVAAYVAALLLGVATIVLLVRGLRGIELPDDDATADDGPDEPVTDDAAAPARSTP